MKSLKLIPMFLLLCVIAACGAEKKNDSNSGDTGGNTPPPPTPAASLYPQFSVSELRFDETQINTSTEKTVTIRYTGATPYDVTISNMPATPFSIAQGGCVLSGSTLSVSSTCDLKFTFTPTEVKNYFATLSTNIGRVLFAASGIDGNNKPVAIGGIFDLRYNIAEPSYRSGIYKTVVLKNDTDNDINYTDSETVSTNYYYDFPDRDDGTTDSISNFLIKARSSIKMDISIYGHGVVGPMCESVLNLKNSANPADKGTDYYISSEDITGAVLEACIGATDGNGYCEENPLLSEYFFDKPNRIAVIPVYNYRDDKMSYKFDSDFFEKFRLDPRTDCKLDESNNVLESSYPCMIFITSSSGGKSNMNMQHSFIDPDTNQPATREPTTTFRTE